MKCTAGHTEKLIDDLTSNKFVIKNLYNYTWLSGHNTRVTPITVGCNEIVLQWKSERRCPRFIESFISSHDEVIDGRHWKSDGSCPNTITFRLKQRK